MEFNGIADWLRFVYENPRERVLAIFTEEFSLDEHIAFNDVAEIDELMLTEIQEKLRGSSAEQQFWTETLPYIHVNCFTEDLAEYWIENSIALETLGHLPLRDKFLWMLAGETEEALLTLGKRHYLKDDYTCIQLEALLKNSLNSHWLWSSLLSIKPNNNGKRKILVKNLFQLTEFEDLKGDVIEEITEEILSKTTRIDVIRKHYSTQHSRLLRGIAQNPSTPKEILSELANRTDTKFAKQIRQFASDNLKARHNTNE